MNKLKVTLIAILVISLAVSASADVRIKDIARFRGYSDNQLVGHGLVFGLNGTGDGNQIRFTSQEIANLLNAQGIAHSPSQIRTRNVAAVMVTATLPPFAKPGSRIDIKVASMGDASSLQGGTLFLTELRAPNGEVFATAQGSVFVGGFSIGGSGTSITQNVPTSGVVSGGGIVQREVGSTQMMSAKNLTLVLDRFDFTTASNMTQRINQAFGESSLARTVDGGTVDIIVPQRFWGQVPDFIATVEGINVATDQRAVVVINERTGTVVIGNDVKIKQVGIAHGNLTITVTSDMMVSQPNAFSDGETVVGQQANITAEQDQTGDGKNVPLVMLPESTTIGEIVSALNKLGVAPRDIMSILQAMRTQGALQAELKVM